MSREEFRRQKDLDAARKAGTAPAELDELETAMGAGPSTSSRPFPPPGRKLKRQDAVFIDQNGQEVPVRAEIGDDVPREDQPIGHLTAQALAKLRKVKQA